MKQIKYYRNNKGVLRSDYRGLLKDYNDPEVENVVIKIYNTRKQTLTNKGKYTMEKAKYIFGSKEVNLAFFDEKDLTIILIEEY